MDIYYKYLMPFDINELRSSLSRFGYQKTSHYNSNIILPSALGNRSIMSETPIRTNSINLPGITFATDEVKVKGYGLNEKRVNQSSYDDIGLTIIADKKGEILDAMYSWFELIHPTDIEDNSANDVEYLEYPENYYGGLEINLFDSTGVQHTTFTFVQPFPTQIGSVQMSWDTQDNLLLIPVSFSYRSYRKNSTNSGRISQ